MIAPAAAASRMPMIIHGHTSAKVESSSVGAAVSLCVGVGAAVGATDSLGVGVVPADSDSDGAGAGAPSTVNVNWPEVGWPSLDTTFHRTVTAPDASPATGCVSTLSVTVGAPSARSAPDASVTCTSEAP